MIFWLLAVGLVAVALTQVNDEFAFGDVNNDGLLTFDEFLRRNERLVESEQISFNSLDVNGDGFITREEIAAAGQKQHEGGQHEPSELQRQIYIEETIATFDSNGDSMLSQPELAAYLSTQNLLFQAADVQKFFAEMDSDQSGSLNQAEFDSFEQKLLRHTATTNEIPLYDDVSKQEH